MIVLLDVVSLLFQFYGFYQLVLALKDNVYELAVIAFWVNDISPSILHFVHVQREFAQSRLGPL